MESQSEDSFRSKVDESGRVFLPATVRSVMGVEKGGVVILAREGDEYVLRTPRRALRRVQEMLRQYKSKDVDLVDELLAERRAEVGRDRNRP